MPREWKTDPNTGQRFLALNERQRFCNSTWRRREPTGWDDIQTGNSLMGLWKAIREAHAGKREPFSDAAMARISLGLKRTIEESPNRRARFYAAAIVFAILHERYDIPLGFRRTRRAK
jgi:hypothetical protein